MVLGVGYVRERLDSFVQPGDGTPLSDEEEEDFLRRRALEEHERLAKRRRSGFDPSDPRSGPLWIGHPLNPTNPGPIKHHPGKFNASCMCCRRHRDYLGYRSTHNPADSKTAV